MIAPRPAGRETNVPPERFGDGEVGAQNRAIWEDHEREVYAEFGRRPTIARAGSQRGAVGAWLAARRGQVVTSGQVGRAFDRDSSHACEWLKHFEMHGLVRKVKRGYWQILQQLE